jgi:bifunctional DNA-binding transcriptional regulator/antitoxin component of YhaV-PrlF toxin-antitoxin module
MAEETTVKLQRVTGLKVKDKTYYRWQVTLPVEVVNALGWEQGDMIGVTVQRGRVVLRKRVFAPA